MTAAPPSSGAPPMPTKFCHACANVLDVRAEICPRCGVRQAPPVPAAPFVVGGTPIVFAASPPKSRTTAGILAILLGGIGVHKFYLGATGMGILYLVFCWTLIPAIVALVEGLVYLTESDAEFYAKHAKVW